MDEPKADTAGRPISQELAFNARFACPV